MNSLFKNVKNATWDVKSKVNIKKFQPYKILNILINRGDIWDGVQQQEFLMA